MKRTLFTLIAAALLAMSASAAKAVLILSIEPSAEKIKAGEQLDVNLRISGFTSMPAPPEPSPPSLGAFDLRFVFNPSILDFTDLSFGDPVLGDQLDLFGLGSITGFAEDPIGPIDLFEISLDAPSDLDTLQADSFILATLTFTGLSGGFSSLNLAVPILADSQGDVLAATVLSATIKVPEPGTTILFGIALAGLSFSTKRRKK